MIKPLPGDVMEEMAFVVEANRSLQKQRSELLKKCEDLRAALAAKEAECERLREQIDATRSRHMEIDEVNAMIERLEKEAESAESRVAELEAECERLWSIVGIVLEQKMMDGSYMVPVEQGEEIRALLDKPPTQDPKSGNNKGEQQ